MWKATSEWSTESSSDEKTPTKGKGNDKSFKPNNQQKINSGVNNRPRR